MGQAASSCQPVSAESAAPQIGACTARAAFACSQQCSQEDSRSVKNFHELSPEQSKKQMQQAQHIVDRTLQLLALGLQVRLRGEEGDSRLVVSQDLKTLELQADEERTGDAGGRSRRVPLSQVVDTAFGASATSLVLRFSDAMCREPMELIFASEEERLQVALTMKVLRARLQ
eukprot:TRINITY_DN38559_c0_g1_i3.p1 TRINITY_DN38559_c0_g1~~TRINITY_DN38559_c0_g1_i3.p1  ORF type:complete len:173 (+),score=38.94 TRINITY_DN38559_c0_g1_i3:64-582(+)